MKYLKWFFVSALTLIILLSASLHVFFKDGDNIKRIALEKKYKEILHFDYKPTGELKDLDQRLKNIDEGFKKHFGSSKNKIILENLNNESKINFESVKLFESYLQSNLESHRKFLSEYEDLFSLLSNKLASADLVGCYFPRNEKESKCSIVGKHFRKLSGLFVPYLYLHATRGDFVKFENLLSIIRGVYSNYVARGFDLVERMSLLSLRTNIIHSVALIINSPKIKAKYKKKARLFLQELGDLSSLSMITTLEVEQLDKSAILLDLLDKKKREYRRGQVISPFMSQDVTESNKLYSFLGKILFLTGIQNYILSIDNVLELEFKLKEALYQDIRDYEKKGDFLNIPFDPKRENLLYKELKENSLTFGSALHPNYLGKTFMTMPESFSQYITRWYRYSRIQDMLIDDLLSIGLEVNKNE